MNYLGLQEFLAVSPEYNQKKAATDKSLRNNMILTIIVMFAGLIFGIVLLFSINFIAGAIFLLLFMIVFPIYAVTSEKRRKTDLEKYGNFLYSQYINSLNQQ